ncbi:MAG: hypothetical protein WB679_08505, partial [Terracidiphilus sp.]
MHGSRKAAKHAWNQGLSRAEAATAHQGFEQHSDEPRVVPLPPVLVMMLSEIEPTSGRVFDGTNLRKEWITACAARGLGNKIEVKDKPYDPRYKGLIVHDLRRSAVRNLVNAG